MVDLTFDRAKLKELYKPGAQDFVQVDVPRLPFATIDGHGNPDTQSAPAIKALFTAIHPIRKDARAKLGKQFVEPPLEMLYWAEDMQALVKGDKDQWFWKAMVVLPIWIDEDALSRAVAMVSEQIGSLPFKVQHEYRTEGLCAQIMHKGKTEDVPALLDRLYRDYLPNQDLEPAGPYHEIYLDDWSRTPPEKRTIILRQPVRPQVRTA